MSITKWKTSGRDTFGLTAKIRPVEVDAETAKTVTIVTSPGHAYRAKKSSSYECYHDSWEAAHAHLTGLADEKLTSARRALQRAQDEAGNVKGMKKPAA